MVEAINQFGFQSYQVLARENKSKNVVFSPLGLGLLVAYLYGQSTATQKAELSQIMGWQNFSEIEIMNHLQSILQKIELQDNSFLALRRVHTLCNRVEELPPQTAFFRELGFGFGLFPLGGNTDDCKNFLNKFFKEVAPFDSLALPLAKNDILAQALSIKINWNQRNLNKNPEPSRNGLERNRFQLPDKTLISHPIVGIVGNNEWALFEAESVQAARITSENKLYEYTFFTLYPKEAFTPFDTFNKGFTFANWQAFKTQKRLEDLIVSFPRYKAQSEVDLGALLHKLMPSVVFSENFQLLSKAHIDMSQDAPANQDSDLESISEFNLRNVHANSSSALTVTDKETGLILLIAAIRNPAQDPL
jgi:serine protease inhibitor